MRVVGTEAAVRAVEAEKGEAASDHKPKLGPVPKPGVEGVAVLLSAPQTRLNACVSIFETLRLS